MKGPFRKTTVLSEQTVSIVRRHFEKGIPFSTLLVDECFSRRLVFQWIQKMCSATRRFAMGQNPFVGFLRIKNKKIIIITTHIFDYIGDVLSLNNSRFGDYVFLHLSKWHWIKEYYWYSSNIDLRMEFTFLNSVVILGCVHCTMIF